MECQLGVCADHAGLQMAAELLQQLRKLGFHVCDYTPTPQADGRIDYPDSARALARDVAEHKISAGIAICGTGIGMSIAANKVKGIRAAVVWSEETAALSKLHNDSNVLCLGARCFSVSEALLFCKAWLAATFEGGRHGARVKKISQLEE